MAKRILLALLAALALFIAPAGLFAQEDEAPGVEVGQVALDLTLKDLDGNVHTLSDYRGKPVLLYFWATW